jgi:multidrug efflux pump subunit AcrB
LNKTYPDVGVRWEGQKEQSTESMHSLGVGFVVALLCMFMLLTLAFRSYLQPLIIMGVIPFGFVGAVWGHALLGLPLTLFSMFGIVALTGVVVNDSIVLVDFINRQVRGGTSLHAALLQAGKRRFRPVMLTSVTTIAGLLPMLTESSFQAQILIPMAASLVFGLISSTVLVLILVPMCYRLHEMFVRRFEQAVVIGSTAPSPQPPVSPHAPVAENDSEHSELVSSPVGM